MKKRFSFVCVYFCLLALLVCGAAELLAPDKGERLSESENRMLAAFPAFSARSVADGSFMSGFESYLSDAFPFRDSAAAFTDTVMKLASIPDDGPATGVVEDERLWDQSEEQDAAFQQLIEEERSEQSEEKPETAEAALPDALPGDVHDVTLWLERADGERETLFTYPADAMVSFAEILNRYRAKLPEDGRLYFFSPQKQCLYDFLSDSIVVKNEEDAPNIHRPLRQIKYSIIILLAILLFAPIVLGIVTLFRY